MFRKKKLPTIDELLKRGVTLETLAQRVEGALDQTDAKIKANRGKPYVACSKLYSERIDFVRILRHLHLRMLGADEPVVEPMITRMPNRVGQPYQHTHRYEWYF